MTALSTATKTTTLPAIGDVIDGDALANDILANAAKDDVNTKKIMKGGTTAKYAPRAWSYGGQVD